MAGDAGVSSSSELTGLLAAQRGAGLAPGLASPASGAGLVQQRGCNNRASAGAGSACTSPDIRSAAALPSTSGRACQDSYCRRFAASNMPRVLLAVSLLAALALCATLLDTNSLQQLLERLQDDPGQGAVIFLVVHVASTVLLFPGSVLALAAGAIYGLVKGTLLVWAGTVVGQTLAFAIGRYLLRDLVVEMAVKRYPKWALVDAAISKEGWRLVLLLRLSPLVPWNVLNYVLSTTGVALVPYSLASALAALPWNLAFVYFGSLALRLADVFDPRAAAPSGGVSIAFLVLSGLSLVVLVAYTAATLRRYIESSITQCMPDSGAVMEELESGMLSPASSRALSASELTAVGGWEASAASRQGV